MNIEVLEDSDDKLKIRVDTNLTIINLLNERIWNQKVDVSAYRLAHPYLAKPEIMVRAKNPKKAIAEAAGDVLSDIKEFRKLFAAAVK